MSKHFLFHRLGGKALALFIAGSLLFGRLEAQAPAPEPPSGPMSLEACIAYAMSAQGSIKIAEFDHYLSQKEVQEFKGIGLPQVSVGAQFQQYGQFPTSVLDIGSFSFDPSAAPLPSGLPDSIRYQTAKFGVKYNASVSAQVNQLLFDGSFFVGVQAAQAYVDLTQLNVQRTKEETALKVTQAYYSALLSSERSKILSANLDRLAKLLATTEAMYNEGFVEKVDVDRLRITLNNLKVEERKVRRLVDLSYDLLKFQMGMPVNDRIELAEQITDTDQVPPVASLVLEGDFHESRTEMALMRQQVHLNELNTKRLQASWTGSLVAFGNYTYQTFRPRFFDLDLEKTWFPASFWGLSYNLNLFDGFRRESGIAKSRLEISKIKAQMDMFEDAVRMEARNASTQVLNAWADVENARENKALSEEVYRIATTKYREGVGSNLEVIDAESTLMESQINYLSSLYSYILATVELKRVKGEILPEEYIESISPAKK